MVVLVDDVFAGSAFAGYAAGVVVLAGGVAAGEVAAVVFVFWSSFVAAGFVAVAAGVADETGVVAAGLVVVVAFGSGVVFPCSILLIF